MNGLPPFRTILSAIGIPTYKLAKNLVAVLSDVTQSQFTVKDSFTFVDEILTQNIDLYMTSLFGCLCFIYQHPIRWNY